jgi:hypothetical protein
MASYATVPDYELRTGTDVPADQEDTVQQRLDDVSALAELYMGDCADLVATAYPDILTALVCANVWRAASIPVGVRQESVGATSVTYDTESTVALGAADTDLLDTLMERACPNNANAPGVGQYGIKLGGTPEAGEEWPTGIDFWVMSGGYRKW